VPRLIVVFVLPSGWTPVLIVAALVPSPIPALPLSCLLWDQPSASVFHSLLTGRTSERHPQPTLYPIRAVLTQAASSSSLTATGETALAYDAHAVGLEADGLTFPTVLAREKGLLHHH